MVTNPGWLPRGVALRAQQPNDIAVRIEDTDRRYRRCLDGVFVSQELDTRLNRGVRMFVQPSTFRNSSSSMTTDVSMVSKSDHWCDHLPMATASSASTSE